VDNKWNGVRMSIRFRDSLADHRELDPGVLGALSIQDEQAGRCKGREGRSAERVLSRYRARTCALMRPGFVGFRSLQALFSETPLHRPCNPSACMVGLLCGSFCDTVAHIVSISGPVLLEGFNVSCCLGWTPFPFFGSPSLLHALRFARAGSTVVCSL
jgi:hypothetical protein